MELPRTTDELARMLEEAACNPHGYAIGERGLAYDAFVLQRRAEGWVVFYTDRGVDHEPLFTAADEAEACAFFYRHITSFRQDHLVGWMGSAEAAEALAERLRALGLAPWRDAIPYWPHAWRHRVFVAGREIFAAREALGALPLSDVDDRRPPA